MKNYLIWFQLFISFFLASIAAFIKPLQDASTIAYLLFIVAAFFLITFFYKAYYEYFPRIFYKETDVIDAFESIYFEAAEKGGRLYSTNVRTFCETQNDKVIEIVRTAKEKLDIKRFIFIDSKKVEDQWIKNNLEQLSSNTNVELLIYSLPVNDSIIPRYVWKIIPRANILLYNNGNRFSTLIGFGQLEDKDNKYKINFAIKSNSSKVFNTLHKYFKSIVDDTPGMQNFATVKKYRDFCKEESFLSPKVQSLILDFQKIGEDNPEVRHIGIFGKYATTLRGIKRVNYKLEHESDIDVIVIVDTNYKQYIIEKIQEYFKANNLIKFVWGYDESYFYHFREEGKTTIDIEIFEFSSEFYKDNQLLGVSIFANYYPIFIKDTKSFLVDIIKLPSDPMTELKRAELVLDDRKGITSFEESLKNDNEEIDIRRVISQLVKNVAWALSGTRPIDTDSALDIIGNEIENIFRHKNNEISSTLDFEEKKVRNKYEKLRKLSVELVNNSKEYFQKKLIEINS